jgi:hypothetical protein
MARVPIATEIDPSQGQNASGRRVTNSFAPNGDGNNRGEIMRWRYLILAGGLLALGGCKNLQTVESLSATLVSASKSLDSVSGELEASCVRQQQFNPALQCTDPAQASKGLEATDALLEAYFSALGEAAGAKSFTVKSGLDSLSGSVSAIPGIDTQEVKAASGLAEVIATLFTEGAREKTLRNMIDNGAPHAKALVAMLRTRVPRALETSLAAEQDALTSQFDRYLNGALGSNPEGRCASGPRSADFGAGSNFLIALEYCRRLTDVQSKRAAISSYQDSLTNIDSSLDTLASSKSDLTAEQLVEQLRDTVNKLKANTAAVQKAFSNGDAK